MTKFTNYTAEQITAMDDDTLFAEWHRWTTKAEETDRECDWDQAQALEEEVIRRDLAP